MMRQINVTVHQKKTSEEPRHPFESNNGRSIDTNRLETIKIVDPDVEPITAKIMTVDPDDDYNLVEGADCYVQVVGDDVLQEGDLRPARLVGSTVDEDDVELLLFKVYPGGDGSFWANITVRGRLVQGCWAYAWQEEKKLAYCDWTEGPRSGSVGGWVETTKDGPPGCSDDGPGECWSITVHDATSGSYKLTVDGSSTDWISFDAGVDDIRTALEGAGASLVDGISALVFDDTSSHTITWTASSLRPVAHNPALEVDNEKVSTGSKQRLFPGYKADPSLTFDHTVTANGSSTHAETIVTLDHTGGGTYALTITVGGGSVFHTSGMQWDALLSEVQDAIDAATGDPGLVDVSDYHHDAEGVHYTLTGRDFVDQIITGDGSELEGLNNYTFKAQSGSTGDGSPDSPPQVCVQVVTDVTWDADSCSPTVTYGYILVTDGPFDDAVSCGASPHV